VPSLWFGAPNGDDVEGTVTLILAAVEATPRGRVARIDLDVDVRAERDLSDWLRGMQRDFFEPIVHRVDVVTELRADGELLWDLDAGRALSLRVEGDLDVALDVAWGLVQRKRHELSARRASSGTLRATLEFAPRGR
jgi:hypothetical protein